MTQKLETVLGYIETGSYLMAFRALSAIESELGAATESLSLDTRTELDVLRSCLHLVVGERMGSLKTAGNDVHSSGFYERLAWLLTRKLLGDNMAGAEVETLMFCQDALGKVRRN